MPANLTADLVASVVMMPALALGVAGEALGLSHVFTDPPLFIAGWGARTIVTLADVFAHAPSSGLAFPSAPLPALVIAYLGIVFACLWRGRLRWLGVPLAAAVLLWPRPPAPVAWIASDGDDAAIVANGEEIALKPAIRAYATQLWAQRCGFVFPADPAAAQAGLFDCDRASCTPKSGASPAIAAWWTRRKPKPDQLEALCANARVLVIRADVPLPQSCVRLLVLGPRDFARGGAAELYAAPGGGYRVLWAQPFRGDRPWSRFSGSDG